MSLHDRDYIREKKIDYKRMEYGENNLNHKHKKGFHHPSNSYHGNVVKQKFDSLRELPTSNEANLYPDNLEKPSNMKYYFYAFFIVLGIIIALK